MEESRVKVKKIKITGMHKVATKSYDLNDDITYFIGENGAGKSTILEAIQLALLGYIPGYAKTNESIMKHAPGPVMAIEAELDNGIKITRTWTRSGSSVQSKCLVDGYEGEISDLLGEVALPVFDFNEFRTMTANKLKEWFITFLPSSSDSLNIREELKSALGIRALESEYLLDEVDTWVSISGLSGIELIRKLNDKFKEDQSFVKGQVAKLQGTIQSLVRYDDTDEVDSDSIKSEMSNLEDLRFKLMQYHTNVNMKAGSQKAFNELKSMLPAAYFDDDPRVADLKDKISILVKQNEVLLADYDDLNSQIQELMHEKAMLPKAGSTCPYTNEVCPTASALADKANAQLAEIEEQIRFKQSEIADSCSPSLRSDNAHKIMLMQAELGDIQSKYDKLVAMQLQLDNIEVGECPTDMTLEDINNRLSVLKDQLVKAEANKKYDELSEKVTADKFKLENELEVYKLWIKKTDANGLQTEMMDKPFEALASEMSSYLSKMFNKPVVAKFNLVSKANSFSFGLDRDDTYIEFDYLSSGERCLFTLALIMCLLDKANSAIRTILIDDILDHLDDANATYLFESLKNVKDIQFILAGVKECSDASICTKI